MMKPLLVFAASVLTAASMAAQSLDLDRELKGAVGQAFILQGYADRVDVNLDRRSMSRPGPTCDSAVEVRAASFSGDRLRLTLEHIGQVSIPSLGNRRMGCLRAIDRTTVTVRGVSAADLRAGVHSVAAVMLPESYLALHGVRVDLPPARPLGDDELILGPGTASGWTGPRPLLTVHPAYTDSARRARVQGMVETVFVVGTDGRVHAPNVTQHPGHDLDQQMLRVLPLWRFEPGRQNGTPVAVRMVTQSRFNLR